MSFHTPSTGGRHTASPTPILYSVFISCCGRNYFNRAGSERPPYAHEWVFLAHFIAFGETYVKLYVAEPRKPLALYLADLSLF